jgi:DMSO/TMAO reductase YedYZ heme-binding membrane subunit
MSVPKDKGGRRRQVLKNGVLSARRLWIMVSLTAAATIAFGCGYFYIRQYLKDGIWRFDLSLVNKSLGVGALFLVALSMFLTGVAYFSGGPARPLAYRKYYGLAGFWIGLAHGAASHILLPAAGLHSEIRAGDRPAEVLGLITLALFASMAAASNSWAKGRMGGARWRRLLRYAGYAGLVLAAGHAAMLKWASWANFVRTLNPIMPSLSLPVVGFAAAAVLLRLAVWLARRRKK